MKTIESVLGALQAQYERELGERTARVARLTELLANYERAVQDDAVTAIERVAGLPGGTAASEAAEIAQSLLDEVRSLPELQTEAAPAPVAPEPIPADAPVATAARVEVPAPEVFPRLEARLAAGLRFTIFGGEPVEQKCRYLERVLHLERNSVAWVGAPNGAAPAGLLSALREGRTAGVVILTELCAHGQFNAINEAAGVGGVPTANGGRGGQGQLLEALRVMERWLDRSAAA